MLDDGQIARMSPAQRRELADRLLAASGDSPADARRERIRRRFVVVAGVSALALVPWTVVLAVTLPQRYVSPDWTLTWVGFDVGLFAALLATTVLAWRRHRRVVLAAAVAATLLCCDAWFDITTAHRGGLAMSVGTAVLLELPLAALLLWVVLVVLRRVGGAAGAAGMVGAVAPDVPTLPIPSAPAVPAVPPVPPVLPEP